MGRIKTFGITPDTGHVGKVVFYNQFGKALQRSMPSTYNDKNSTTQQNQRYAVFSPMQKTASALKTYCKSFFQTAPAGRSAFSTIMHQLRPAFGGTRLAPTVNFKLAKLGSGQIPRKSLISAIKDSTTAIDAEWPSTADLPNEDINDHVSFIVMKNDGSIAIMVDTGVTRGDGNTNVAVPAELSGQSVVISNPIFSSDDGKLKSDFYLADAHSPVNLA
jgi:hypothetical protein